MSKVLRCLWCDGQLSGKQTRFCSPKCGRDHRRDLEYFGGNLKNAVGYKTRTCWVCGKTGLKKIHTHHVYGRGTSDDPLTVLCPGCHGLVSDLARRLFLADPKRVAHIVTLARAQAQLPDCRTVIEYREEEGERSIRRAKNKGDRTP